MEAEGGLKMKRRFLVTLAASTAQAQITFNNSFPICLDREHAYQV
jgi:hypothetical protein